MTENPFRASDLETAEHRFAMALVVAATRVSVVAFLTLVVVFSVLLPMFVFTEIFVTQLSWESWIVRTLGGKVVLGILKREASWPCAFGYAIAFLLPYVLFTLLVIVSLIGFLKYARTALTENADEPVDFGSLEHPMDALFPLSWAMMLRTAFVTASIVFGVALVLSRFVPLPSSLESLSNWLFLVLYGNQPTGTYTSREYWSWSIAYNITAVFPSVLSTIVVFIIVLKRMSCSPKL